MINGMEKLYVAKELPDKVEENLAFPAKIEGDKELPRKETLDFPEEVEESLELPGKVNLKVIFSTNICIMNIWPDFFF